MGNCRQNTMRTIIPVSPGPTSNSQFTLPAGGLTTVAMHTTVTTDKSTKGIRKYESGTVIMVLPESLMQAAGAGVLAGQNRHPTPFTPPPATGNGEWGSDSWSGGYLVWGGGGHGRVGSGISLGHSGGRERGEAQPPPQCLPLTDDRLSSDKSYRTPIPKKAAAANSTPMFSNLMSMFFMVPPA